MPARDVYTGSLAGGTRLYAQTFYPRSWSILSAKHGFLLPSDLVPGPYEASFASGRGDLISIGQLREQLERLGLLAFDDIVVIAGAAYARVVRQAFGQASHRVRTPLDGCGGIGKMLQRLKQARLAGKAI